MLCIVEAPFFKEFCYEGQCGSRPDQCKAIWGPTGREGDRTCFQQNTNGIIQGNCGYDVHTRQFKRCLADDIMCGRLQCATQAERPIFGDPTTVTSAYTYVRICVDAKCKERSEVSKTVSKCNDQCHYRGVCNNVGNCHCENGFGGIACEIPGFGGSVNSNPSNTSRGESLNAVWADGGVTYSVNERPPQFVPPAIPLMSINNPAQHQPRSPDQLLAHIPLPPAKPPVTKPHFTRTPSVRPKEPPPMVPVRPRDSVVQELYKEHGAEMGIKSPRIDFASRDLPTPPPDDPTGTMKKDTIRPIQPPPPPPKHQKTHSNEFPNRPPLPAKPPEILNGTDKGVGVRELAARFDAQRTARAN
ncbi:ADAM cysteine-rich [Teladorsagia circumcincta]|uniref:ADAM cysteine-rich n=1 Tax=Teladorsagia circumcincta TaxID=45464 RepID=A0A2G9V5G6_TELCI|nr:ADAM cysteine-rich [Teladorsagia circumcincta]